MKLRVVSALPDGSGSEEVGTVAAAAGSSDVTFTGDAARLRLLADFHRDRLARVEGADPAAVTPLDVVRHMHERMGRGGRTWTVPLAEDAAGGAGWTNAAEADAPKAGDRAVCKRCGNPIRFTGDWWTHKVDGRPELRHPAAPTANEGRKGAAAGGGVREYARDAKGEFAKTGSAGAGKSAAKGPSPAAVPSAPGRASKAELAAAKRLAAAKIAGAPVPGPDKVEKMRAALERAKTDPKARAGGDARGSSYDRKRRAKQLFDEFGGGERGYVVCHGTGLKMHWTDDPAENPSGYPKFEQGKIFTARQGGGYQVPNLLPESFQCNRSRNDEPVRPENLK